MTTLMCLRLLIALAYLSPLPAALPTAMRPQSTSSAFWLRRGVRECRALPTGSTTQAGFVSPLNLIAAGQAQAGDTQGLRSTLDLLRRDAEAQPDAGDKALAYVAVAQNTLALRDTAAFQGDLALATQAAAGVEGQWMRPLIDQELAHLQASAGDWAAARLITEQTQAPLAQAWQDCELAWLAHEKHDARTADEWVRRARLCAAGQEAATLSAILLRVAQVEAARGDFTSAAQTAQSIPDLAARAELYRTMARLQSKSGDGPGYRQSITRARETAAQAASGKEVRQLSLLCDAQLAAQDRDGAQATLRAAMLAASSLTAAVEKVSAWFDVADAQAILDDVPGCRQSITRAQQFLVDVPPLPPEPIEQARRRLVSVALSLARSGEVDATSDLCRQITDARDQAAIHWALSDALANAGDIDGARLLLHTIRQPTYRAFACRRVAQAYARVGDMTGLTNWLDHLSTAEERSWAALGAAEGLLGQRLPDASTGTLASLDLN